LDVRAILDISTRLAKIQSTKANYRRVTVIDRQPELPAPSYARTVTTFTPGYRGTVAVQDDVPVAFPLSPSDVDQRIDVTPTLSVAVPPSAMVAAVVLATAVDGDAIRSVGGVRSVDGVTGGGVTGGGVTGGGGGVTGGGGGVVGGGVVAPGTPYSS
jgi:hypothetical protein